MAEQSFVKLSKLGAVRHKELEQKCLHGFIYWIGVGCVTGVLAGQLMMYLPLKNPKRYRNLTMITGVTLLTYHGYKLSKRELKKGQRQLLADPDNIIS